jgi:tRNA nucleotidyltransferase (CCA-adding enzyme)
MLPDSLRDLFVRCRVAEGRALLVGGSVRDALLGHPSKDLDIEVHGLPLEAVVRILRTLGPVNEVGRAFGVLKVRHAGHELDVSLPRRDQREGVGHKGIRATSDPDLGVTEAARRRDLTINAIAYDPLTDTFEDPFGGRADLERRLLRAVDPTTFGEDPLRALRVAQFVARFGFAVDPALEALCAEMPLAELPSERVRGEVEKLLLKGRHPALGWDFAARTRIWEKVLPEWGAAPACLDRVARVPVADPNRRLTLLYAAACSEVPLAEAEAVLDRLRVFRVGGFPVRRAALSLLARQGAARPAPGDVPPPDAVVRRLGEDADMDLLAALVDSPALLAAAERLGVRDGPLPALLSGTDLTALGVPPGPELGRLLAQVRGLQLDGAIATPAEARAAVARLLVPHPSP